MDESAVPLFVLAFDHRQSFARDLHGMDWRTSSPSELARLRESKSLIGEGLTAAARRVAGRGRVGALVDPILGAHVAREARRQGLVLAIPVETPGERTFHADLEECSRLVDTFAPDLVKALVHWNPQAHDDERHLTISRLAALQERLARTGHPLLLELIVRPTPGQLALYGSDAARFDVEARPYLALASVAALVAAGIHPRIWKIEGFDRATSCAAMAGLLRGQPGGGATALVLGRGESLDRVVAWLATAAGTPGFAGFAVGRSVWWTPLSRVLAGDLSREAAAHEIAARFLRLVEAFTGTEEG